MDVHARSRFALYRLALALFVLATMACCARSPTREPADMITVVTLNLWHDKADWPKREAMIVRELRALQPDVIALQEVLQHEALANQAKTLADALGYHYVFVSVDAPDKPRRYGNAILTRHRIVADDWKALLPLDDYRAVAHARIQLGARQLEVYATHLNFTADGGAIRRQQISDLLAFERATSKGGPTLVLGDFNAPANAPEFAALATRMRDAYDTLHPDAAQDAIEHTTLNPLFNPPLRIDHVMFESDAFDVVDVKRLFVQQDAAGTWASDHFGVWARLRWKH
jgi:endonuclease/exonuclease/phosphatase family metal-dependent hydrolase